MKSKLLFAALIALLVPLLAVSAPRAEASASGCTLAPGAAFSQNCITVRGDGLFVVDVTSAYSAGAAFYTNVCDVWASFKYKPLGASSYKNSVRFTSNCGLWRGAYTWWAATSMADHSSLCATQKNSVISSYANYACVGISS